MDTKTSTTLNPQFQETYNKIMGITPQTQPAPQAPTAPPQEHTPQPLQETVQAHTPTPSHTPHISAFGPSHAPEMRGEAIGTVAPEKKTSSNHLILKMSFVVGIFLLIGYVLLWLKFFDLPLPF